MTEQLSKADKDFISFNQVLAIVSMIASILPAFLCYILFLLSKAYNSDSAFVMLAFPLGLYSMWIATIIAGFEAEATKASGVKTKVLLFINSLISVPLLIGYTWLVLIVVTATHH